MKILMLSTHRGSPDGCTLNEYLEGEEYDLSGTPRSRELAEVFVREKWAVANDAPAPAAAEPEEAPAEAEPARPARRGGKR